MLLLQRVPTACFQQFLFCGRAFSVFQNSVLDKSAGDKFLQIPTESSSLPQILADSGILLQIPCEHPHYGVPSCLVSHSKWFGLTYRQMHQMRNVHAHQTLTPVFPRKIYLLQKGTFQTTVKSHSPRKTPVSKSAPPKKAGKTIIAGICEIESAHPGSALLGWLIKRRTTKRNETV